MSILKALIGGLIGAVLATVALMYLRDGSMRGYEWFPLVTGLLTGLGARLLTGSVGRSLATGAVAAIVSLIAILAGDELVEIWKLRNMDLGPVAGMENRAPQPPAAANSDDESATDEGDSADGESDDGESEEGDAPVDAEAEAAKEKARQNEAAARSNMSATRDDIIGDLPPAKRPKSLRDFLPYIFSGLGVLIAYQLGRGGGSGQTRHADHHDEPNASTDHEEAT